MTPEERSLVLDLVVAPGRPPRIDRDEFLHRFGVGFGEGVSLGVQLVSDAIRRKDPTDVALALVVGFNFGFTPEYLDMLVELAFADWHHSHEDVAGALDKIRSPETVKALHHLAKWVPSYLAFDGARALAVKAIWALGKIATAPASEALESLSHSENSIIAENASFQLERIAAGS